MPRLLFLLGVAILLVSGAFILTDNILGPSPGPTEANALRVKPGMKLQEVQAILGGRGRSWCPLFMNRFTFSDFQWTGPGGSVLVSFWGVYGAPPVVRSVSFQRAEGPNLLERLCSCLGL
jgi:hypothetical protein